MRSAHGAVLFLTVCLGSTLAAQAQPSAPAVQGGEPFADTTRVTAVDLVVEVEQGWFARWLERSPEARVAADELAVLAGGVERPVVAVEPAGAEAAESWRLLIYLDAALSSSGALRQGTAALAAAAGELVALGEVEVIVAAPDPVRVLAPSRDQEAVMTALSALSLSAEGLDLLAAQRFELFEALASEGATSGGLGDLELHEVARALAVEESRLVRRQLDHLLAEATAAEGAGARRALFLLSGGYDLDPAAALARSPAAEEMPAADPATAEPGAADPIATGAGELAGDTETVAQTLAAYGWSTFYVVPPAPPPLRKGLRIGKLRILGPALLGIPGVAATWDAFKDAEKADALVELGAALEGQGRLEQAAEAYAEAAYHYYDDPKTADRQAAAMLALGRVLGELGRPLAAREAYARAAELDPEAAGELPGLAGALLDPLAPLDRLAAAGNGGAVLLPTSPRPAADTVAPAGSLNATLERLTGRLRITYQLAGEPDGELFPVAVQAAAGARLPASVALAAPAWGRAGTPPAVAALRARRLVAGELLEGELALHAEAQLSRQDGAGWIWEGAAGRPLDDEAAQPSGGELTLEIEPIAEPTAWRLTLAIGGPRSPTRLIHQPLDVPVAGEVSEGPVTVRLELPARCPGEVWLAAVVDELVSGRWGGALVEFE